MMDKERYNFLQQRVFGSKEALELFTFELNQLLSTPHRPTENDPNNEGSKIAMAVAEMYQYFINQYFLINNGEKENDRRSTGNPSLE